MVDKFVLELGYELLSLVDKENGKLLDEISKLRKQKPFMPKLRIMDNMTLEPTEIAINKERHSLKKNKDFSTQIVTFLDKYVENHPNIQQFKRAFKTGESLSFQFPQKNKNDFKVNLMLENYPAFWNSKFNMEDDKNTNCSFANYITEISETSDGLYKVEIINTKANQYDKRFILGGRFKFYLKQFDILNFQYYDGDEYTVKAKVTNISNNCIELKFDKKIEIPAPFLDDE